MKHPFLFSLLFVCCTLPLISPANAEENQSGLHHVVLMWLKQPGDAEAKKKITAASYSFAEIPGVLSVRVGASVASERDTVDDSFDLGIILSFPNKDAMQNFLNPSRAMVQRQNQGQQQGTTADKKARPMC
jgi:hypothetical protein